MGGHEERTALFADRYELVRLLGAGGMADVHLAADRATQGQVALKRLRLDPAEPCHHQQQVALFEREYLVLNELAHPRAVQVLDYGVCDGVPYFTMELLDGGDLKPLSPLDPGRLCAIFRDVCSVLSLLHSRRLIHRDLSPRNIRCTAAGVTKLIDFGAMVPIGPTRTVVGTPAFSAPEVVAYQHADGRADLFAVGAAMYYALTGGPPFPARSFLGLQRQWETAPLPPAQRVADIPPALSELVMDLLRIDPRLRPDSAAEVIDRLVTIGGLSIDGQLQVSRAYLVAPPLVDREQALEAARVALKSAQTGHGQAVLFRGEPGSGRSRLLEACALESKLAGAVVASADMADAAAGEYGVVRTLARQLLAVVPEAMQHAAPYAQLLGHVLPEVRSAYPDEPLLKFTAAGDRRPRIQGALRAFLTRLCQVRPLVLAVDDVHSIDEPSAALLALLMPLKSPSNRRSTTRAASTGPRNNHGEAIAIPREPCLTDFECGPRTPESCRSPLSSLYGHGVTSRPLRPLWRSHPGSHSCGCT